LATALVESAGLGAGLGYVTPREFDRRYRDTPHEGRFLVVKCHDFFETAGTLLAQSHAKAIGIHRDVRDVAVSYMNFRGISFASMLGRGFIEAAVRNDLAWSAAHADNVHISRYDDLLMDLSSEVNRIAAACDLTITPSEARRVAAEYSLERNRERMTEVSGRPVRTHSSTASYDCVTLIHRNHITRVSSGRWKNSLSHFQLAVVEYLASTWLEVRGYPFSRSAAERRRAGLLTLPLRAASRVAAPVARRAIAARRRLSATPEPPVRRPLPNASGADGRDPHRLVSPPSQPYR
jgi:hypothetical protein